MTDAERAAWLAHVISCAAEHERAVAQWSDKRLDDLRGVMDDE